MTTELRRCPFCGGDATISYDKHFEVFYIRCENDGCPTLCQSVGDSEEEAVGRWNHRKGCSADSDESALKTALCFMEHYARLLNTYDGGSRIEEWTIEKWKQRFTMNPAYGAALEESRS
jgi:hypothetical protein